MNLLDRSFNDFINIKNDQYIDNIIYNISDAKDDP